MRLAGRHLGKERLRRYTADEMRVFGREWKKLALSRLNPEDVYGPYLTGSVTTHGSLICRDPGSPTGDEHPSAVVTTKDHPKFEPCRFYSFRTEQGMSVFDFMIEYDPEVSNFYEAKKKVARLSGTPLPAPLLRGKDRDNQAEYDGWN